MHVHGGDACVLKGMKDETNASHPEKLLMLVAGGKICAEGVLMSALK